MLRKPEQPRDAMTLEKAAKYLREHLETWEGAWFRGVETVPTSDWPLRVVASEPYAVASWIRLHDRRWLGFLMDYAIRPEGK